MTQLADLIKKAKNGKRIKEIFSTPSSSPLLNDVKSNVDGLAEQIAILDAILFKEMAINKAGSKEIIYELESISQNL